MLDIKHVRDYVITPTLKRMGGKFHSPDSVCLLLGTAIHESRLEYLRQIGGGPALGLFQIEPATIHDIHENFLTYQPEINQVVSSFMSCNDREFQAVTNLAYSTALARLVYYRRPEPLPNWDNSLAVAEYWKQHYNTIEGAGYVEDFRASYINFVMG
jgi:hypothetical protein